MNQDKRTSRVIISVCLLGVFLLLFAKPIGKVLERVKKKYLL